MSEPTAPAETVLQLRGYGVAFGEQTVLSGVTLSVPARGAVALLGPVCTGKSTLLRSLAGFNDSQPSFRWWGTVTYAGGPLGRAERPALVSQNARLLLDTVFENLASGLPERNALTRAQQHDVIVRLLERAGLGVLTGGLTREVIGLPLGLQRRLAVTRTAAANPRLLLLDEPTAGLPDDAAGALLDLIRAEAGRRAILMVTHNQEHARAVASRVALLASGRVCEEGATDRFFRAPQSDLAQQFVRTGSCPTTDPAAPAGAPDAAPDEHPAPGPVPPAAYGPRGFHWLKPGRLGGTPRPGILYDVRYDLEALKRVGVRVLVTLEEEPFDPHLLREYDIEPLFVPVPDMGAPSVATTRALCARIEQYLQCETTVAIHCRAGLGRTGTQLACQLIWEGCSPLAALERVRQIEPRWVQSDAQVQHLKVFARALWGEAERRTRD
ncbi:phosphatase domain-containing putative toxin [Frigoriglobus tundricola]|uniref:ABC transporter domain-containing protein n=1 Tax=Frigoriglobus tundricola TaxID=2774151 RepID=A0A6M5YL84_9BACT|nr:ATP-binding cassette domain-containing protein [Frigoriglobus tundricola]QJW94777.1 hypothetical protein FTUN_2300 [Frigoriglobus tundricola]